MEILTFLLSSAPEWLEVDATTGRISGTPSLEAAGKYEVILHVINNRGGTVLSRNLSWK